MKKESHELLSLTSQPMHMGGKLYMSFSAGFAFDLATAQPIEPAAAYAAAMKALAPGDCLDLGLPKKEAEWLLAGSAFESGKPVKRMLVSAQVGERVRRFILESHEPFSSMPLTWEATWGNDEENPQGARKDKGEKAQVTDEALPNDAPACMGPRGAWPCRMKGLGTFDDKWLKKNWPGLPDDADWGFYNLSQLPQRLSDGLNGGEKITLINLNEKISKIESQVPNAAVIFKFDSGGKTFEKRPKADTLWLFPNECVGLMLWHAVAECENEAGAGIDAAKAELEIDGKPPQPKVEEPAPSKAASAAKISAPKTVKEVATAAAAAAGVAAAAEAAQKTQTESETSAQTQTTEAESKKSEEVNLPQSEPEDAMPTAAEMRANAYAELERSLPEINAALAEAGLPPLSPEQVEETRAHINKLADKYAEIQAMAETEPPTLEEALAQIGASDEQIASVKKALDIPVPNAMDFTDKAEWDKAVDKYISEFSSLMGSDEKTIENMKTLFASIPIGEEEPEKEIDSLAQCTETLIKAGMEPAAAARFVAALEEDVPQDPKELLNYATRLEEAAGFPEGSVRGHIEKIQNKMEELGVPMGSLTSQAEPPALQTEAQKMAETSKVEQETTKKQAEKEKTKSVKAEEIPLTAENIPLILASGGSLAGAKLDGFNLVGFNFSRLDLKGTSFAGAKLDGARFDGAKVAGASFAGAAMKNVSFSGADLSKADFASVAAEDGDFSNAVMSGANFTGASLIGATLSKTKSDGISAVGADLSRARLSFSDISGADFSGANLSKADLHEVRADGANFAKANMESSTLCWGSSARGSSFAGAELSGANWTNVDISGSDFTQAKARGASFTDCDISQSNWTEADAMGGDFSRSSVEGASMRGINLFKGSLREARASGADLSESCLFGADLCRMVTDESTNMRKADIGQTIVEARKV